MLNNKLDIAKTAIKVVASAGVTKVVKDIIDNNTDVETTTDDVKVWIGSAVISSMVTNAASNHIETQIGKLILSVEKMKKAAEKAEENSEK